MLLRFWPKTSMWITSEACVMCCDPFSYTRVVLIHWTLRRPLCCVSQALERGTTTGRWATSWRDRTWWRTCMNPEMTEPRPCHIWTLSHLDCVTSGQQLHRHKLFYLSRHCFTDSSCSSFSGTWSLFPALEEMIVGFSVTVFAFYLVLTLLLQLLPLHVGEEKVWEGVRSKVTREEAGESRGRSFESANILLLTSLKKSTVSVGSSHKQ